MLLFELELAWAKDSGDLFSNVLSGALATTLRPALGVVFRFQLVSQLVLELESVSELVLG